MTRRKVKLAFIVNQSDRKASYKKRKRGLMKKVQELSTLCGIDACAILYGPYDDEPEAWPSDPDAMNHVLTRFKVLPEAERAKRMVNQEGFTKHRVEKMKDQLKRVTKDNRDMEVTNFIRMCLSGVESVENFDLPDLNAMGCMIQRNLKEITRRVAYLKKYGPPDPQPHQPHMPPDLSMMHLETGRDFNHGGIGGGGSSSMAIAPFRMPAAIDGHHHQMQNFTWDIGTMSTYEQQPRFDDFGWAYNSFLPYILNSSNGAGPGNGGFDPNYLNNNGAGPSYGGVP